MGSDRVRLAVRADGSTFFDGLSVDNANGIVDKPRLPRFKAYTNHVNYVGIGLQTKIGLNNTDNNDQGAFDAADNHSVAPADGTCSRQQFRRRQISHRDAHRQGGEHGRKLV